MNDTQQKPFRIEGAARIGSGTKLHPAHKQLDSDGHYEFWIRCACPGTSQGGAYNRATFIPGATRTCRI